MGTMLGKGMGKIIGPRLPENASTAKCNNDKRSLNLARFWFTEHLSTYCAYW